MADSFSYEQPCNAILMLQDGTSFKGWGIGKEGSTSGELCFNTGMTGYQETLTDPSYAGQIITFTFPHIGNVGCNKEDIETLKPSVRGLILRNKITEPSNFRSESHLNQWLKDNDITGISGIDTRRLTRHIRISGAKNAVIFHAEDEESLPDAEQLKEILDNTPNIKGLDLADSVTCKNPYEWNETLWEPGKGHGSVKEGNYHIVAMDFGEKLNILRSLAARGCKVTVVPAGSSYEDIMAYEPDGVFLSNGPGDPAATSLYTTPAIKSLINSNMPIFGICLGHQLLAIALDAKTEKMHQGHRGANHPVRSEQSGNVEITSQNHGFVVSHSNLPSYLEVTHISLFDGTIEGLRHKDKPVFSVQYHPESSPGPHDSQYLFDQFIEVIAQNKNQLGLPQASGE